MAGSILKVRVSGHFAFHQTGECKSFIIPVQCYSDKQLRKDFEQ